MTEQLFILVNGKVVPTPWPRQASCLRCKPAARPCVSNSSPTVRLHVPHFSFPFFFFCRQLLMFALPPWPWLQWGWHCSVCCMSQIWWSWMWSIIIRQRCKARRPWEEEGIVLQMSTSPLPRPLGNTSSVTWNHFVLHKQPHILSLKRLF